MNNKKSQISEILLTVIIVTVFLLTLSAGAELFFKSLINQANEDDTDLFVSSSETFESALDSNLFYSSAVLPLIRIADELPNFSPVKTQKYYQEKLGLNLTIYLFDTANKKLIDSAPQKAPNKWLVRKLYPMLTEPDKNKVNTASKKLNPMLGHSFGFGKSITTMRKQSETLIEGESEDREPIRFLWSARKNRGLIITFPEQKLSRENLNTRIKFLYPDFKYSEAGLVSEITDPDHLGKITSQTIKNAGWAQYQGKRWYLPETKSRDSAYINFNDQTEKRNLQLKIIKWIIRLLSLFILFCVIIGAWQNKLRTLKLKHLIFAVFTLASIIPLLKVGLLSIENIKGFKGNYQNKLKTNLETTLDDLIFDFSNYMSECSQKLLNISEELNKKDPDLTSFENTLKKEFPGAEFTLRDLTMKISYNSEPDISVGGEQIYKALAKKATERYCPHKLDAENYKNNPFMESLTHKDDMGFGRIANSPRKLYSIDTGAIKLLYFFRNLETKSNDYSTLQITIPFNKFCREFLNKNSLKNFSTDNLRIQLSAFSPAGFKWLKLPDKKLTREVFDMVKTASGAYKRVFRAIASEDKKTYGYALTVPSKKLDGLCLTAYVSGVPLKNKIQTMKNHIIGGCAAGLILLFAVMRWLLNQLLKPIDELSKGIKALETRNFSFKLTIPPGKDELTKLFSEFNFMLGENKDMQVAQNIQETLFTKTFPEITGYSFFGQCKQAPGLGGDGLSCSVLPNGSIFFLLGDISARSIGAALMTAYARAVCFLVCQHSDFSLKEAVEDMDAVLSKNRPAYMYMGIICGVLDPSTGRCEIVTRGHIFPLFKHEDSLTWVGEPAWPIGLENHSEFKSSVIELKPGDRLFCFTDGLIGLKDQFGEPVSYERVQKISEMTNADTCSKEAELIFEKLTKIFPECGTVGHDDFTVFALGADKPGERTNG